MKGLKEIVFGLSVLGAVGCSSPTIEKHEDLTGDGITDILVKIEDGLQHGTWLYIGQKDGSFLRAVKQNGDPVYFKLENGDSYFYDGEKYCKSPKKD